MSISAGYIVLAVLLLRLILKKAPKWIAVALWGIVAVRLICPFSFESVLSLIPSAEVVSPDVMIQPRPQINTGIPIINSAINPIIQESTVTVEPEKDVNTLKFLIPIFAAIWIAGMVAMIVYTVVSYVRVKRRIGTAVLLRDNIYQSESVVSPFVLGVIKPRIYLPFNMNEQNMTHVIAHENAHIRRRDHLWKPLGFLLLALHWFNPLMWLGYILLCRDIELACDEKVIRELDCDARADYSEALLACSVNRRMIAACPLAFGEVGVKKRIKSALNYKKPAFWIIIGAIIISIVVAVCFLTNPKQHVKEILVPNTSWECENYDLSFKMTQNFVIEGSINTPDYNGIISIGIRYAGKNAVAEIFKGDWEYAQGASEEPLLAGTFRAKDGKLIFELKDDNIGLNQKELIFCKRISSDITPTDNIFTEYNGVYATIVAVSPSENGNTIFVIEWHNDTDVEVTYGEIYSVEYKNGDNWVDVTQDKKVSPLIGLLLRPHRTVGKYYYVKTSDISKSGTYRLVLPFSVDEGAGYKKYNTWVEFKVDENSDVEIWREKYSEYFGLDASKGLDVYVSQMAKDSYGFILTPHSNTQLGMFELMDMKEVGAEGMRQILSTYAIDYDSDVYIVPWQNPLSSYIGEFWIAIEGEDAEVKRSAYINKVKKILFGTDTENNTDAITYPALIYATPSMSWILNSSEIPNATLDGDKLYDKKTGKILGSARETTLEISEMLELIAPFDIHYNDEFEAILQNNARVYAISSHISGPLKAVDLYYLLIQKDGSRLLVYGHYGSSSRMIRWIFDLGKD